MQLEIFCLCKRVVINALNQATLIDIFDKKVAIGEPALVEPFSAVASLRFYGADVGQHKIIIRMSDESGRALGQPHTEIVSIAEMQEDSLTFFHVVDFAEAYVLFGKYLVSIEIDGIQRGQTPLYVSRETT